MARFSNRKKRKALPITQPRYVFEGLEPRLLLSADPFSAAVADSESLNPFPYNDPSEDEALAAFAALTRTDADTLLPSPETPVPLDLDSLAQLYASEDLEAVSAAIEDGGEVTRELVIVDAATPDYQQLLNDLTDSDDSRSFEIVILQGDQDGIEQISAALSRYTDLDAVHIISHGTDAAVQLGDTRLDSASMVAYADAISGWGDALTAEADLLFYGCDLAATADGRLLVESIAGLTGADVAASDDLTGHADQGGDWELEIQVGAIESVTPFTAALQQSWNGVLSTINITATADTHIDKNLNSDNFGASTSLMVDKSASGIGDQRALLQFDLSTVPVGATITTAKLHMEATSNTGAFNINVYEVTASWSEGSADGGADAANWDERMTGTNWSSAGGSFDSTVVATLNTASTGQHTWDITSLVQDWYAGSTVNNGIIISSPDAGGDTVTYDSREGITAPVLEISYLDTTLYLDGIGDGSDVPIANLKTLAPTDTTLDNFDPGRDSVTGLLLEKGGSGVNETDPVKYQLWVDTTAGTSLDGQATLTLWSALKNFNTSNGATVTAYLLDRNADGSSVTEIASATISRADWDTADTGTWIEDTFDFGSVNYQLANDRYLGVKIIVDGASSDDMWFAYDVTTNPSKLSFDANDAPVFLTAGPFNVDEGATAATIIGDINADDGDGGAADVGITYSITVNRNPDSDGDNAFAINPTTGVITVNDPDDLDYENASSMVITVEADDGVDKTTTDVTIDINDVAPILSASGAATTADTAVFTLNLFAAEPGINAISSWTIDWGDGSIETVAGNPSSVTHTYTNVGFTNNIVVSATDGVDTYIPGDMLVVSNGTNSLFRFDATSAAFENEFADSNGLAGGVDVEIGPDGLVYVTGFGSNDLHRYNATTGAFVDKFSAGSQLARMAFGPDGNVYVTSMSTNEVLRFDVGAGTFSTFVTTGSGTLAQPDGIAFGADGNLYVTSGANGKILRYNGSTGASIDTFAATGTTGYSDIQFGPDGNLYFSNVSANKIVEYHGTTGADLGDFVSNGSGGIDGAAGFKFGADGDLYVVSFNNDQIYRYSGIDGSPKGVVVTAAAGMDKPINLVFTPTHQVTVVVNQAPVLVNNSLALNEGETVTITGAMLSATDTDNADSGLTFNLTGVSGGQFELTGDPGTEVTSFTQQQISDSEVVFVDDGDENPPAFGISVTDGTDNTTPVAAVINFSNRNDAPMLGIIGNQSVDELVTLSFTATATDADLPADTLTFSLDAASLALGMTIDPNTGAFSWTPSEAQGGLTPSVTVTVTDDGTGNLTDSETFTITVNDVNIAPVIVTNTGLNVPEEATRTITSAELETTDADNTPAEIVYTLTSLPSGGSLRLNGSTLGLNDTFTQDDINNGRVTYRDADEGASTSFQFTVSDGTSTTGNITFSVNGQPINDAPVVKAPSASLNATEQVNLAIEGLGFSVSDIDEVGGGATATLSVGEGTLTVLEGDSGVSISGGNGTGNLTLTGTIAQLDNLLTGSGTGTITYLNTLDAPSASTVMTVTVNDQGNTGTDPGLTGDAGSEEGSASQTINITAVNDAPVLGAIGNQSVDELATLTFTVTATDSDLPADTLTFSLDPASLALGMTIDANTGAFSWTPSESQGGLTPSVTVTVTDNGTGNLIDNETFQITVNDTNTAPVLGVIGNQSVDELATLTFTVTATDSDLPADTLTFSLDAASLALGMTIDANTGAFSWTPTESQGGLIPSVTVTVTDDGTGTLFDSETFQITVNDTNTSPVLGAIGAQAIDEGATLTFTATATDSDLPADTLTFSLDAASLALGMTIDANTGAFSWTPTESQGALTPSVTVTVTDNGTGNLIDNETFTITVNGTNTAPVITSDGSGATAFVNAAENQTAVTTVTSTDADLPVDTLTYTKSGGADQALFNLDAGTGVLTFASAPDFETSADANLDGVYEVEVQVSDGIDTDTQLISVTVTDGNEVPTTVTLGNLTVAGNSDGAVVSNLTTIDPDSGDSHTYTVDDARFEVVAGQLKLKAGQTLDFASEPSISLNVTSTDAAGLSVSQGFTLTVTNTETVADVVPQFDPPAAEIVNESLSTSNEIHIYSTSSREIEAADVSDESDEGTDNESEATASDAGTEVGPEVVLASLEGGDGAGVVVDDARAQGDSTQKLDAAERKVLVRQLIEIFSREGDVNKDFSALFEEAGFLDGLNGLRDDVAEDAFVERTMIGSSVAAATGLSVGYVVWLLRSGMLLSSVLSSMPAWRLVDPLPVLAYLSDSRDDDKDDDSLASLIAEHGRQADPAQENQDEE